LEDFPTGDLRENERLVFLRRIKINEEKASYILTPTLLWGGLFNLILFGFSQKT
jgi:hypothetical protein